MRRRLDCIKLCKFFLEQVSYPLTHLLTYLLTYSLTHLGANKFLMNRRREYPAALALGINVTDENLQKLHLICNKRDFIKGKLLQCALKTPIDWRLDVNDDLYEVEQALVDNPPRKSDALKHAEACVKDNHPFADLYYALSLMYNKYPVRQAERCIQQFESKIETGLVSEVPPIYYFLRYYIWYSTGRSKKKLDRLRAADALSLCRLYPCLSEFLDDETDTVDKEVVAEKLDDIEMSILEDDDEDDDYLEDDDRDPDSPGNQWKLAKESLDATSASMDKLMKLTGMREIKKNAVNIFKDMLLAKKRKEHGVDADVTTGMNFLFVGNPGTGKTTVATLFAAIMVELGFRTNATPIIKHCTDVQSEGEAEFEKTCVKAKNGTLFIDEAYLLKPAPKGSNANTDSKILDILLRYSEENRENTTFILGGYKEDILNMFNYNDGFKSRFPITLDFADYDDRQLAKIYRTFIKERRLVLESKKECGISLANVVAARVGKARGKKGFGNARDVRAYLDRNIKANKDRLGTLLLLKHDLTAKQLVTLSRIDVLGDKPDISMSPVLKELNSMIGLKKVKDLVRGLIALQSQNYEAEARGEKAQVVALSRMFLGNPGTGKTTVAKLYAQLLRELGLLSNGDLIKCTAADLTAGHVGGTSEKALAIMKQAEGNVLLIDEAYCLDPTRGGGGVGAGVNYGGEALDVIVQKLDGSAGQDMAIILAGYEPEMMQMMRNSNPGLSGRFQPQDAVRFDDYTDDELYEILLGMVCKSHLMIEPETARGAVALISQSRRLGKFRNAGTVENYLGRAKANKAKRLQDAFKAKKAIAAGTPAAGIPVSGADPDPNLLIAEDFIDEKLSVEKGREAFDDLFNIPQIKSYIDELEVFIKGCLKEKINPVDLVSSMHMVFTGPPGTGKTTIAKRMGILFMQLKLLPSSKVVKTTGTQLQGRYVGETKTKVIAKMEEALGGILFIDEAYAMVAGDGRVHYGDEVITTMVELITQDEYHGNLIVIMAGYENDMNNLFKRANEGFRSRFDKKRLVFPPWDARVSMDLTLSLMDKENKRFTESAKEIMAHYFEQVTYLLTHSLTYSLTHSLTHSLRPRGYPHGQVLVMLSRHSRRSYKTLVTFAYHMKSESRRR